MLHIVSIYKILASAFNAHREKIRFIHVCERHTKTSPKSKQKYSMQLRNDNRLAHVMWHNYVINERESASITIEMIAGVAGVAGAWDSPRHMDYYNIRVVRW